MTKIASAVLVALLWSAASFAASSVVMTSDGAGGKVPVLEGAPNPLTTYSISDDYSHNTSLTDKRWFQLEYAGSGSCKARIMNDTTKASWVSHSLATSKTFTRYVHPNALYLNYSGCNPSILEEH